VISPDNVGESSCNRESRSDGVHTGRFDHACAAQTLHRRRIPAALRDQARSQIIRRDRSSLKTGGSNNASSRSTHGQWRPVVIVDEPSGEPTPRRWPQSATGESDPDRLKISRPPPAVGTPSTKSQRHHRRHPGLLLRAHDRLGGHHDSALRLSRSSAGRLRC